MHRYVMGTHSNLTTQTSQYILGEFISPFWAFISIKKCVNSSIRIFQILWLYLNAWWMVASNFLISLCISYIDLRRKKSGRVMSAELAGCKKAPNWISIHRFVSPIWCNKWLFLHQRYPIKYLALFYGCFRVNVDC